VIEFAGRAILLDIEGTTSSISFVYDVMFPFARRELESYLSEHWGRDDLVAACGRLAEDAGHASFDSWMSGSPDPKLQRCCVKDEVARLMDADVKSTGLKELQGLVWRAGFESGEMQSHVYDDVVPALERWSATGLDIRVYSSGSIGAQKLFFGHTIFGDLLGHFRGHYDTTIGSKSETESYRKIAAEFGCLPSEILFVSDVVRELDAAQSAEFRTVLSIRPGNPDLASTNGHPSVHAFDEIVVART
jgi:enolase-phosphatase E1